MARGMQRFLLPAAALLAGLVCGLGTPARANILIQIDKPSQTMTVSVDELLYRWPVSTGATGFSTPDGSYTPFRMEVMHYSQEWDNAGMPHAIFFTTRGHSIHGSDHPGLGTPVSHGCVRLSLTNATTLYDLVTTESMGENHRHRERG
jgi:lipoprotein-anchoring transpeptidase ErfK/SrfK